jgi:hypothetical protein
VQATIDLSSRQVIPSTLLRMPSTKKPKAGDDERQATRQLKRSAEQAARDAERDAKRAAQPPRLTREQFDAGEPCPGCGMSLLGVEGDIREFVGTMYETPEQRNRRLEEDAAFIERHPGCHDGRWSMSGSWVLHCASCCPPHPLSQEQIETLSRIIASAARRPTVDAPIAAPQGAKRPAPKTSRQRITELEGEVATLRAQLDRAMRLDDASG